MTEPEQWAEELYVRVHNLTGVEAIALIQRAFEEREREDAARYRWLRDVSCPPHNFYISVPDEFHGVKYGPGEVDAYIDAARQALKETPDAQ